MTFRCLLLEHHLEVAAGDVVPIRLEIHNDAPSSCDFTIGVVGLDDRIASAGSPALNVTVPSGESAICSVPVSVPGTIGTGQHSAAVQVASSEVGSRPVISEFTVSISSLAGLEIIPTPSPVRGKRRAKFHVDVVNNEPEPLDFVLTAEANDVAVKFAQPSFSLAPGERSVTAAKLKASPLRRGEPVQHNVLITAQGRASTSSTTVPYVQRPLVARGARVGFAALAVIALWAVAIAGVFVWLDQRDEAAEQAAAAQVTGVDTDGDGIADVFYDETGMAVAAPESIDTDGDGDPDGHVDADGDPIPVVTAIDTDGDGIADSFVDENGAPVVDPSTGADGSGEPDQIASTVTPEPEIVSASVFRPSVTTFSGTVSADGEPVEDIRIVVTPITLGGADGSTQPAAFAGDQASRPGKIWSARRARATDRDLTVRQSDAVDPREIAPGVDGLWKISDIPLGPSYEVAFSKVGFDTQRFVLTPTDDGQPVELDVELVPAIGLISGRVVGPSGPLGGADIKITDGTLVFETTADTDGDVGSFVIERVSTPGVFTLTASLRGYGTEVVQVELDPGEQAGGIQIVMQVGVATVTGRVVDEFGRSLPGVSVSATNGTNIRRTTTLTAGDVGFYALPQLDVPSEYTIDIALDGYASQTRRIPIGGSVAGVNFVLERTSSTLSGSVTSAGETGGIVGAGVTLTNGDLKFRTSTTNSPDGFFSVSELPAGNYTVTVEHFEHQPATEFVTVVAGEDPDPVAITLPLLGDTANVGTGELVVEVIDPDAEEGESRSVAATVSLVETRTGRVVPTPTEPASTVRIVGIAPGTYTLQASARAYAPSAPRQVSIGLQSERREVELRRLGQASGRMIDSVTKDPIGPYSLELLLIIGNTPVDVGLRVTGQADGTWATQPRTMIPGEYLVRVNDDAAPAGYRVIPDQELDRNASDLMRFIVIGGDEEPNVVNDIEADPFPDLGGRILKPFLNGTNTELVPIDDPTVTAFLRCDGSDVEIEATMIDELGGLGGDQFDTYEITKQQIAAETLIGDCRLDVSADGYVDGTVGLPSLEPDDLLPGVDRVANVALYSPADAIGGTIAWEDPRGPTPVFLDGVDFGTDVIVEFPQGDTDLPDPGNQPEPRSEVRTTTSSAGGLWVLPGQLFGAANYQVTAAGFDPTSFDVVIDESRNRTVTVSPDMSMTPASPATDPIQPGVPYALQLDEPFDGNVCGRVNILTEATPEYGAVTITAVDPESNPVDDTAAAPGDPVVVRPATAGICGFTGDGTFTIADAAAGTWDVDFTLPDNHILHTPVGAALRATDRVDPDETQLGFDTTLVDLAKVTVSAVNLAPSPAVPITSEVDIALNPVTAPGPARVLEDVNLPVTVEDVAVDINNPAGATVQYLLDVNLLGFDPISAEVFVDGISVASGQFTNIPVFVRAGRDVTVEVRAFPFGEVIGSIGGEINATAGGVEPLDVSSPSTDGRAEIAIFQSDEVSGSTGADVTDQFLVEPTGTDGQFRVSGPSGYYRFVVSHPQFGPPNTPLPSDTYEASDFVGGTVTTPLPNGVFEMPANATNTIGEFRLPLRRADVNITVFEPVDGGGRNSITDYAVELDFLDDGAEPTYTLAEPAATDTNPEPLVVPNLLPGSYDLTISAVGRFSFISTIVVSRTESGNDIVTVIDAPLPSVGATITGTVEALNERDEAVALPAVTVTRVFDGSLGGGGIGGTVTADGTSVDVDNDNSLGTDTETISANPVSNTANFAFSSDVALGTHTVSVTPPTGFTASSDQSLLVDAITGVPLAETFTLRADNVDVDVTINATDGGTFTQDAFTATLAAGAATPVPASSTVFSNGGSTAVVTFENIAPSLTRSTLQVSDPIYNTVQADATTGPTEQVLVPANTAGTTTVASPTSVSVTPLRGVVEGSITQDGDPLVVQNGVTSVTLVPAGGGQVIDIDATGGSFEVGVAPGDYLLSISNGLDATRVVDQAVTVDLGQRTDVGATNLETLVKFVITTTPSLPAGATVEMEQTPGGAIFQPQPANSLDFYVPANSEYKVIVSGSYPSTEFPQGSTTYSTGDAPATISQQITLPRTVEIITTNIPTGLQIKVKNETKSAVEGSNVFLPGNGTVNLELSVGNDASDVIIDRSVADEVLTVLEFDFTDVVGTLTLEDGVTANALPITATSGTTELSGVVTSNDYLIEGLTTNANGSARTWTIAFDQDGYGTSSDTIAIDQNSSTIDTLDLTVVARSISVTFDVLGLGDNPVTLAEIDFDGAGFVNTRTFSVSETRRNIPYSVRHPNGSLQPITGASLADPNTDPLPPVNMVQANLQGVVSDLTGPGPTESVRICPSPTANDLATECAGPGFEVALDVSGAFSTPALGVGMYFVEVRRITNATGPVVSERIRSFTVNADGSVTVGSASGETGTTTWTISIFGESP